MGRSWRLLGSLGTVLTTILGPTDHKIENKTVQGLTVETFEVDFGAQNDLQNDPKSIPKAIKNRCKDDMEKNTNDARTRAQTARLVAPQTTQNGTQDELKTSPRRVQNRVQNRSEKMIAKWTGQSSTTNSGTRTFGPRGPPGRGRGRDQLIIPP